MTEQRFVKARSGSLITLFLLLGSCLFFSIYDLTLEKIWWSTAWIYAPCSLMFGLGIVAWRNQSLPLLKLFGWILLGITLFLIGYGVLLCIQTEWLWGPMTIGFGLLTCLLTTITLSAKKHLASG